MGREGVGGFLESILAVMVVITASSVFLVVLASGTLQVDEDIDREDLISWLEENGLYSETGTIPVDRSNDYMDGLILPNDISGMKVTYRFAGNLTPVLSLSKGVDPLRDALGIQLPLLIEVDGRAVAGTMEVRAWR